MVQIPFNRALPYALITISICIPLSVAAKPDGKIQPGQWRTTDTVLEMVNPLMSPDMIAKRKAKPLVVEYCVKSDDLRELMVGQDKVGLCQGDISFSNGRISVARTCTTGLGKATRKIEGTYSAVKTDTMRETTLDTPQGPAHSKSHVVSERIGECKGG
jgi:Protein of unknown function (DUF3617)